MKDENNIDLKQIFREAARRYFAPLKWVVQWVTKHMVPEAFIVIEIKEWEWITSFWLL